MIDTVYIEAAIETLDLVHQLSNYLHSKQELGKMGEYISQIQTKADARISSSLGQTLGISIPVDQEGRPPKYWEGVRDMAKLSQKKWLELMDINKYLAFLSGTRSNLAGKIGLKDTTVNPLEDFVGETPVQPVAEPANPLEDMLSIPELEPTMVSVPKTISEPITPTISRPAKPEPITSEITEPKPVRAEPVPAPRPIQPEPTPRTTPVIKTPDKLSALDEALKASGIETSTPPEPSSSLSDMLLAKEDGGEKSDEEDDMLSLSLREALKILRDEDED